jgi:hypothetical protein
VGAVHSIICAVASASCRRIFTAASQPNVRVAIYMGNRTLNVIILIATLWSSGSFAQTSATMGADDLSKESENPVTRLITLPLRYEAEFLDGATKSIKDTFEIDQAVVPFRLNNDWSLITRTKLPAEVQPPNDTRGHWVDGLSNGYTTFFLSPEHGRGYYWGAGPVLYYPSATNSALGVNKWGSGPSAAFFFKDASPLVLGLVANNIWSFGGPPGSSDRTNQLLLNPFISYHLGDGWALSSSPNITANWLATGEKWTVPVGGGLSKTFHLGEQPIKLAFDAYYNAIRPDAGKDMWLLQATMTFVFSSDPGSPLYFPAQK